MDMSMGSKPEEMRKLGRGLFTSRRIRFLNHAMMRRFLLEELMTKANEECR